MLYTLKFISGFLLPPGLFVVVLAGLAFGARRTGKQTAIVLSFTALLLYLSCAPWLIEPLMRAWEQRYSPPQTVSGDALVVLTGGAAAGTPDTDGTGSLNGSTLSRVVTTAELYKKYRLPVIVSGGQVFDESGNEGRIAKRKLIALGVPESAILLDDQSRSTAENARNAAAIIRQQGFARPVLVTSAFHMERSLHHFRKQGIHPVPYPTDYRTGRNGSFTLNRLAPSSEAAHLFGIWTKELAGLLG